MSDKVIVALIGAGFTLLAAILYTIKITFYFTAN